MAVLPRGETRVAAPTEPRRAPADDDGPRDGRIGSLALGLLGVLALLAGSGAIAYSRRRA